MPQSISLIDDTLERNIALAINDENIDKKKIDKVIELSNLDRFVNKDRKSRLIGERGLQVSGEKSKGLV